MAKTKPVVGTAHFQQFCMELTAMEIKARENGFYATARLINDAARKAGDERLEQLRKTPKEGES